MSCVKVAAIENADGIIAFRRKAAKTLDEADLIVDFELWSRRHRVLPLNSLLGTP